MLFAYRAGGCGELGHGDKNACADPKLIGALDGKQITMVACGQSHTAACSSLSGALYTWGYNLCFRLGHGDVVEQTSPKLVEALTDKCVALVACGGSHTAACTSGGDLYTWGAGEQGQLGHGDLSSRQVPSRVEHLAGQAVTVIACGQTHSAAIVSPGTLFTWGHGMHGRLGHGHTDRLATPTRVRLLDGTSVTSVACGQSHTAAVNDCGLVFTWGDGFDGQLGHGSASASHVPKRVASLRVEHNAEVHTQHPAACHSPALVPCPHALALLILSVQATESLRRSSVGLSADQSDAPQLAASDSRARQPRAPTHHPNCDNPGCAGGTKCLGGQKRVKRVFGFGSSAPNTPGRLGVFASFPTA